MRVISRLLPAVAAHCRRPLQRADAIRAISCAENMKGRHVRRHAGPITLTVIAIPGCTVRES
jgi:hypothetical protein